MSLRRDKPWGPFLKLLEKDFAIRVQYIHAVAGFKRAWFLFIIQARGDSGCPGNHAGTTPRCSIWAAPSKPPKDE